MEVRIATKLIAVSGRFGYTGSFSYYNYYNIIEGNVSLYHVGFVRAQSYVNPSPYDAYGYYRCPNNWVRHMT